MGVQDSEPERAVRIGQQNSGLSAGVIALFVAIAALGAGATGYRPGRRRA